MANTNMNAALNKAPISRKCYGPQGTHPETFAFTVESQEIEGAYLHVHEIMFCDGHAHEPMRGGVVLGRWPTLGLALGAGWAPDTDNENAAARQMQESIREAILDAGRLPKGHEGRRAVAKAFSVAAETLETMGFAAAAELVLTAIAAAVKESEAAEKAAHAAAEVDLDGPGSEEDTLIEGN